MIRNKNINRRYNKRLLKLVISRYMKAIQEQGNYKAK